jgi:hypothetical protein
MRLVSGVYYRIHDRDELVGVVPHLEGFAGLIYDIFVSDGWVAFMVVIAPFKRLADALLLALRKLEIRVLGVKGLKPFVNCLWHRGNKKPFFVRDSSSSEKRSNY